MAFLLLTATRLAAAEAIGMRQVEVFAPERQEPLHVSVWYPTTDTDGEVVVGDNAVFFGSPALVDAAIADGRFPLVVISHGGFRAAPNVANWLASALATEGFIVANVGLPTLPSGPATPAALHLFWLRPADLSATITALGEIPEFGERIDMARVGGVGFFLGGTAVMSLAGARIDPAAFARSCGEKPETEDCEWFAAGGVDLHRVDATQLGRSNFDPRLKVAIATDPEFIGTLTAESLRSISIPVGIIAVASHRPNASETDLSALAANIPHASYAAVHGAGTFSAFPECKPTGPAVLKSEGEVALCDDDGDRPRAAIHAELTVTIATRLQKALQP